MTKCIREYCKRETDEKDSVCLVCEKIEHDAWLEHMGEKREAKENEDLNKGIRKYD